jgi:hypothetical protein
MARLERAGRSASPQDNTGSRRRTGRWLVVVVLLGALALISPIAVARYPEGPAWGVLSSNLDQQEARWGEGSFSTRSGSLLAIPRLSGIQICARNEVSATVSMVLRGAPVTIRVLMDGRKKMRPSHLHWNPRRDGRSLSFTFLGKVESASGSDHHTFDLAWRSPTGRRTTLDAATINLLYEQGTCS